MTPVAARNAITTATVRPAMNVARCHRRLSMIVPWRARSAGYAPSSP